MHKRRNRIPARVRLTDCEFCKQPFVNPIMDECHEVGDTHWHLLLRCGYCEAFSHKTVTQAQAEQFEDDLDAYMTKMWHHLRAQEAEIFEDDIERFVSALNANAILPEDFGV